MTLRLRCWHVVFLRGGTGKTQTARLWAYGRNERHCSSAIPPATLAMVLGPVADHCSISLLVGPKRRTSEIIWRGIVAGCLPLLMVFWRAIAGQRMVMPGSKTCIAPVISARLPARLMSGASSPGCTRRKGQPSHTRSSGGSPSFMPSKRWPGACRPNSAPRSGRPGLSSPAWKTWLNAQLPDISGKSPLASAIRYAPIRMAAAPVLRSRHPRDR